MFVYQQSLIKAEGQSSVQGAIILCMLFLKGLKKKTENSNLNSFFMANLFWDIAIYYIQLNNNINDAKLLLKTATGIFYKVVRYNDFNISVKEIYEKCDTILNTANDETK